MNISLYLVGLKTCVHKYFNSFRKRRVKSFNYDTETAFSSTFENDAKEGLNCLVKSTFSRPFFF